MMLSLLLALACAPSEKSTDLATNPAGPETPAKPATSGPTSVAGLPEQTTPSGLKSWVIRPGTGAAPQPGQTVDVHYTGWLKQNGEKFDSSLDRGQPLSFTLGAGEVIPGWEEGVALMKVGEKRQLEIPPNLGYGEAGAGGVIPPNATLIFDVELVGVH